MKIKNLICLFFILMLSTACDRQIDPIDYSPTIIGIDVDSTTIPESIYLGQFPENMMLKIMYSDNSSKLIPITITMIDNNELLNIEGNQTIKVNYNGFNDFLNIVVKKEEPIYLTYKVNFDSDGGSYIYPLIVKKGNHLYVYQLQDKIPQKENFIFEGWYYNDQIVENDFIYDHDITLKAKWINKDFVYQRINGIFISKYLDSSTDVILPDYIEHQKVTSVNVNAFNNINSIKLPKYCNYLYYENKESVTINNILVNEQNDYFKLVNDVLYSKDLKTLVNYPSNKTDISYEVIDTVEKIASQAFCSTQYLKNVTLPANLKEIEPDAFYQSSVETIDFSDNGNLTKIGYDAFSGSNIKHFLLPNTVTEMNSGAFSNCKNLETFNFEDNSKLEIIDNSLFFDSSIKSIVIPKSVKEIGRNAFYNSSQFKTIIFESDSSLIKINDLAFEKTSIESITIPHGVIFIGQRAFKDCVNLQSVNFENGILIDKILESVFENCNLLTFTLPDSVKILEEKAFYGNRNLNEFNISNNSVLETIEKEVFLLTSFKNIYFPKNLKIFENDLYYWFAFDVSEENPYYKSINGVLFNKDLTELIKYPQYYQDSSYTILSSVQKIGKYAFAYALRLEEIIFEIDNNLLSIEESAFHFTNNLQKINIPNSLVYVGDNAFSCNFQLQLTSLPENLEYIGKGAFYLVNFEELIISEKIKSIDGGAFNIVKTVYVSENNPYYSVKDGVLYNKDYTELIMYPANKTDTTFIVPNSVIKIGEYAFDNNKYLSNVVLSNQLKTIGAHAFSYVENLKEMIIPSSVEIIGKYAFHSFTFEKIIFEHTDQQNIIIIDKDSFINASHGFVKLYFHNDLVELYKSDTNWVIFKDRIVPIS